MKNNLERSAELQKSGYEVHGHTLPRHLLLAVEKMRACAPLKEVLGEAFVETYLDAKEMEYEDYASVLSPWETKYLMLTV